LGAVAASAFGAGFGGAVWALVPTRDAAQLCETLRDEYCAAFPQHAQAAEFFASPAGPPAQRLDER
jgi:galactokinase